VPRKGYGAFRFGSNGWDIWIKKSVMMNVAVNMMHTIEHGYMLESKVWSFVDCTVFSKKWRCVQHLGNSTVAVTKGIAFGSRRKIRERCRLKIKRNFYNWYNIVLLVQIAVGISIVRKVEK
jgi:hypothetical protein